ncbi:MAG TPA: hypothetical protein VHE30_25580 [Polyangiaceae bacterium]|nr:hypothetical protein [Polyangiaceae bacterium]
MTDLLTGKTIRWTYVDGPTKGKSFEHRFFEDGSVEYRMLGGKTNAAKRIDRCEVTEIGEDVVGISYLGDEGWTLTSILDYRSNEIVSFASNEKQLVTQRGSFEEVVDPGDAQPRTVRNDGGTKHARERNPERAEKTRPETPRAAMPSRH